jgi:glycine cleavage system transcriptional repressor
MASDAQYLVLSALGPDRSGLVADVTQYLTSRGANVEDSRMAVLGEEFGIMILISGRGPTLARVVADLAELEQRTGLGVLTRETKGPGGGRRGDVTPCTVTAEALDHEGIVYAVSAAIHALGINIVSLGTKKYEAPVTGSALFRLEAHVDVPRDVTLEALRHALGEVAASENVDIDVRPSNV